MMRKINKAFLGVFSILILAYSCKSQKWPYENVSGDTHLKTIFGIDLQIGFLEDTVSIWINKQPILINKNVSSIEDSGFSGVRISLYEGIGNLLPKFYHIYNRGESNIMMLQLEFNNMVQIELEIRPLIGKPTVKAIPLDFSKGRFLGIGKSKGETSIIYLMQSEKPFNYH